MNTKSTLLILILITTLLPQLTTQRDKDFWLDEDFDTGYIPIDTGEMFYFLFKSRDLNPSAPLFIYLEGGPGLANEISIVRELGPYRLHPDLLLTKNEYSWINTADGIFVDCPLGAGYSLEKSTGNTYNDQTAVEDLYKFIVGILDKYPEYKGRSLYLTGVSYAGHFIPQLALYIYNSGNTDINLQGLGIGNPWVYGTEQIRAIPYYSRRNGLINNWQFLISNLAYEMSSLMFKINWKSLGIVLNKLGNSIIKTQNPKFDTLNIAKPPRSNTEYILLNNFFNSPYITKELEVNKTEWRYLDQKMHNAFGLTNAFDNYSPLFTELLNKGLRIHLYSGELDWVINTDGVEGWINNLKWEHIEEFRKQPYLDWVTDGKVLGKYKTFGGLTYSVCFGAGHWVTADQPAWAYDMFSDLIYSMKN